MLAVGVIVRLAPVRQRGDLLAWLPGVEVERVAVGPFSMVREPLDVSTRDLVTGIVLAAISIAGFAFAIVRRRSDPNAARFWCVVGVSAAYFRLMSSSASTR
jgi:hypothetical protein